MAASRARRPAIADVIWSTATLLTLNPLGAPIAHIALHFTAVVHSWIARFGTTFATAIELVCPTMVVRVRR